MILVIDNYDSFVYNLARYMSELGWDYVIFRNDAISMEEIAKLNPSHILISPGPGTPDSAGISMTVVKQFGEHIPILGVCLGHQCIGQVYGGKVKKAKKPMHGKTTSIQNNQTGLFNGLPASLSVTRYHSLIVEKDTLPDNLQITSETKDGEIMSFRHSEYPVYGVQFHPEAVLTEHGHALLENFLAIPGSL